MTTFDDAPGLDLFVRIRRSGMFERAHTHTLRAQQSVRLPEVQFEQAHSFRGH